MTLRDWVQLYMFVTTRFLSPLPVATEWVLVAICALIVYLAPFGPGRLARRLFTRLAHSPARAILLCALLPLALRLLLIPAVPAPDPSIHDEFSHLLLADTLAHGRLTNPTHPMWTHLETIHVIQQPTYNSMYPPGLGSFLALGQVLFHEPWVGILIAVSLMFGALHWMMRGWLRPTWALAGTLIAILKFGVVGLWVNSYLSGAVAGIGGALLLGAAARIRSLRPTAVDAALLAAGPIVLINTRPFEGSVLSLAVFGFLLPRLWLLYRKSSGHFIRRLLIPAAAVFIAGLSFTLFYSYRVTGNPLRMPYQVNRDTYGWPENLAILPPKQLTLRHQVMADMYTKELNNRRIYESSKEFFLNLSTKIFENWTFFIGPLLTIPLLFLPWMFRDRRIRPLILFIGLIAALNFLQMVLYPYHLAPVVPIIFVLVAQGIRYLWLILARHRRARGFAFATVLPIALILIGSMKQFAGELGVPLAFWENAMEPHRDARAEIAAWLARQPGKHLVLVRYRPWHSPDSEWVYNGADIDASHVVWARDMKPAENAEITAYFRGRRVWLLEADLFPPRVVRYPPPDADSRD